MVTGITSFYIPQMSANDSGLFIYCYTANDPKLSGLKI